MEIKMISWFNEHWYKVILLEEGKEVIRWIPSVTTKLGIVSQPFLAKWRGDIGNREADYRMREAQDKGSRIHHAWYTYTQKGTVLFNPFDKPLYSKEELDKIEKDSKNVSVLDDQEEMLAIWKLDKFVKIVKPTIERSEDIVYSLKNNDAGTLDNVFLINKGEYPVNGSKPLKIEAGRYIVDLKTGNQVGESAFRQVAAYAKCHEEMGLGTIDGTIILHTNSKNKSGIEGFSTILRTKDQVEEDYKAYRLAASLWEIENKNASPKIFDLPSLIKMEV